MNGEYSDFYWDVHWFKRACNTMGLAIQSDDTCDLFAEMVADKWKEVKDIDLARLVVFSDLMGIK